jgi:hypothetical protein
MSAKRNGSHWKKTVGGAAALALLMFLVLTVFAPMAQARSVRYSESTITTTLTTSTTSTSLSTASATSVSGATSYQETNSLLSYSGYWRTLSSKSYSGGTLKYLGSSGSATISFNGTSLTWIATKGTTYGKALVTVDGGAAVWVDLYSSKTLYQRSVYTTGLLADGSHTVSIAWTGKKNSSARGYTINLDAVSLVTTAAAAVAPIATITTTVPRTTTATVPAATITTASTTTTTAPAPPTTTPTAPATTTTTAATTTTTVPATTTTTTPSGPSLNVRDYGAKGDGVNDDTATIQAGIAAAVVAGKQVYFPAGTYLVSAEISLPSNVVLRGDGDTSVIYKAGVAGSGTFRVYNHSNVGISNLKLASNYANTNGGGIGINVIAPSSLVTVSHVTFSDLFSGIKAQRSSGSAVSSALVVSDCVFTHCGVPVYTSFLKDSTFTNLTSTNTWYYDLYAEKANSNLTFSSWTSTRGATNSEAWFLCMYSEDESGYSAASYPSENLSFYNMRTTDARPGVHIGAYFKGVVIDGFYGRSSADFNGDPWFHIEGSATVKNSDVSGNWLATNYNSTPGAVVFQNGQLTNCQSYFNNPQPGILLQGGAAVSLSNVTVSR